MQVKYSIDFRQKAESMLRKSSNSFYKKSNLYSIYCIESKRFLKYFKKVLQNHNKSHIIRLTELPEV